MDIVTVNQPGGEPVSLWAGPSATQFSLYDEEALSLFLQDNERLSSLLTEELFQHIWQFRLFQQTGLHTLEGEPVQVLSAGTHNRHAGPDFTSARIRIGSTLWAGNVELHLKTSDWYRHRHQHDPRYHNVILHVVFEHDMPGLHTDGIPCLELHHRVSKMLLQRYEQLRQESTFVPCGRSAATVPELIWTSWKERLMIERLEQKADVFQGWLAQTRYNWEEVTYWAIAHSLGQPVNTDTFIRLAQSFPFKLLGRHRYHLPALEALLFGQAGMLETPFYGEYPLLLQREYNYMRHKYRLLPLSKDAWKWLRMRPTSFPTIRIAALAGLLQKGEHLFSRILEAEDIKSLEYLLPLTPSSYWQEHYRFDITARSVQQPGIQAVHALLINAVLPLIYLYGREKQLPIFQEKAVFLMNKLPAENNSLIKDWNEVGIAARSAADSQALLQLKHYYCDGRHCLSCNIGTRLLKDSCPPGLKKV